MLENRINLKCISQISAYQRLFLLKTIYITIIIWGEAEESGAWKLAVVLVKVRVFKWVIIAQHLWLAGIISHFSLVLNMSRCFHLSQWWLWLCTNTESWSDFTEPAKVSQLITPNESFVLKKSALGKPINDASKGI